MNQTSQAFLLQALAAMAWADGELAPAQRKILTERVGEADVSPSTLKGWMAGMVTFPDKAELLALLPSMEERLEFVTHLLKMSSTDGRLAPQEAKLLGLLGPEFGMNAEVLAELTRHVR